MNPFRLPLLLSGAIALTAVGCSSNAELMHRSNPAWNSPPGGQESIAMVALEQEAFIIVDRDLLTADLQIFSEEIHPQLLEWSNRTLLDWSGTLGHPAAKRLFPSPSEAGYPPRESKRVRQTLFLPVQWPWPGDLQRDSSGKIPDLLLIPSELTIGCDLNASQLYDYLLANTYTEPTGEEPQQLTAVLTWSLWDNRAQQYRSYGLADAALPLLRPITMEMVNQLYQQLLKKVEEQTGLRTTGAKR